MTDQKTLGKLDAEDVEKRCPDCGSTELEQRGDEIYCKKCGLVVE